MTLHKLIADVPIGSFKAPTDSFSLGSADANGVTATNNLEHFVSNMIGLLTILGGLIFVFYFVMGGVNWITAGGEQAKVTKARDQMVEAVIGMVVIVISYGLMGVVGGIVGFDFLHPAKAILGLKP